MSKPMDSNTLIERLGSEKPSLELNTLAALRIKQLDNRLSHLDTIEKARYAALIRALQEIAEYLNLNSLTSSPSDIVKAVKKLTEQE